MAGYSEARRATAKTQRSDDAHRVVAQGTANLGGRGRRATARSDLLSAPAEVIPERPPPPRPASWPSARHYLAKEHRRRDIGSRIVVLDLGAPDRPASAPPVIEDHDGAAMQFLVVCTDHHQQKHFKTFGTAWRSAKASHQWCDRCKRELIAFHKLHARVGG